ncbi:Arc family DNA-binding protein [Alcanivorax sp.]|uniref:Arc family DNA-binding protein n=1 Tax=Alcanivorax sp. TaxID=1872427 RepID=UPI0019942740|nr:Arc family DNA-binding protein [Alcanivorax sp.]MBD3643537.1 Arc family DNA-binding protein [Alcanivorax sp.]
MDKDDRYTRITLRIPRELHSKLTDEAERTSKSLNAEIIGRLEDSFAGKGITAETLRDIDGLLSNYRDLISAIRSGGDASDVPFIKKEIDKLKK